MKIYYTDVIRENRSNRQEEEIRNPREKKYKLKDTKTELGEENALLRVKKGLEKHPLRGLHPPSVDAFLGGVLCFLSDRMEILYSSLPGLYMRKRSNFPPEYFVGCGSSRGGPSDLGWKSGVLNHRAFRSYSSNAKKNGWKSECLTDRSQRGCPFLGGVFSVSSLTERRFFYSSLPGLYMRKRSIFLQSILWVIGSSRGGPSLIWDGSPSPQSQSV
ncbi:hypothetical protein CEXT_117321 [Caerostris extrusa]|uniref:Uncharacterized protein n=1 Tax=Caerostris extrusa TaxID=172846 RepID=A0AAV4XAR5_CAEEX|nr:hypothetical protein CEXT_117321 [Caerostris extrusa]